MRRHVPSCIAIDVFTGQVGLIAQVVVRKAGAGFAL